MPSGVSLIATSSTGWSSGQCFLTRALTSSLVMTTFRAWTSIEGFQKGGLEPYRLAESLVSVKVIEASRGFQTPFWAPSEKLPCTLDWPLAKIIRTFSGAAASWRRRTGSATLFGGRGVGRLRKSARLPKSSQVLRGDRDAQR